MSARQYVVLHEFTTRVDDETGEEKTFAVGDVYDGPPGRVDFLLDAKNFPDQGPLIAAASSGEAKEAEQVAKTAPKQTESVQPANQAETKGA